MASIDTFRKKLRVFARFYSMPPPGVPKAFAKASTCKGCKKLYQCYEIHGFPKEFVVKVGKCYDCFKVDAVHWLLMTSSANGSLDNLTNRHTGQDYCEECEVILKRYHFVINRGEPEFATHVSDPAPTVEDGISTSATHLNFSALTVEDDVPKEVEPSDNGIEAGETSGQAVEDKISKEDNGDNTGETSGQATHHGSRTPTAEDEISTKNNGNNVGKTSCGAPTVEDNNSTKENGNNVGKTNSRAPAVKDNISAKDNGNKVAETSHHASPLDFRFDHDCAEQGDICPDLLDLVSALDILANKLECASKEPSDLTYVIQQIALFPRFTRNTAVTDWARAFSGRLTLGMGFYEEKGSVKRNITRQNPMTAATALRRLAGLVYFASEFPLDFTSIILQTALNAPFTHNKTVTDWADALAKSLEAAIVCANLDFEECEEDVVLRQVWLVRSQ